MASSKSPRTVKVRGRRRASASSRVRTDANRARAPGSNGWRSPSRVRHAGSDSPSSRVRLFFSTTRPEFSHPSSKEIQRSNGPGTSTPAYRPASIKSCPLSKSFSMDSHIAGRRGNRLAGSVTCPRCGAANAPGTMFCVNCGSALSAGTASTFNNFLIILVIGTIVTGLASVFFTYAIQNQTGRMLLLGGYAANIVLQIAIFVVLSQAVGTFVDAMFPGGTYSPGAAGIAAADFAARVQTLGYLSAIPALIYAGAYYLVWNRINKGEIPASTTPPPMAAAPLPPR